MDICFSLPSFFSGLDMSPYLLGDAANEIPPETPPIYDLYATVNHYGNIYIGHYVANVKPPSSQGSSDKEGTHVIPSNTFLIDAIQYAKNSRVSIFGYTKYGIVST